MTVVAAVVVMTSNVGFALWITRYNRRVRAEED